ncbi:hypothetical protein KJ910_02200 [Patescibacteria group bacterium]|nr:hypothetical protein [Patescibacteria group bacterium]MBU1907395.1 hypothetical protein [Patescibacteria group bacterium]
MTPEELKKKWADVENEIEIADIILVHKRKGPITTRIRKATKSYWNHAAIVLKSKQTMPMGGPLIVEASFGGIEIHQMKKYADRLDLYDFGVLRYPGISEKERKTFVRNFILSNLDVPYDYTRLLGLFLKPTLIKISPKIFLKFTKWMVHEDAFVCSTFVYKAYKKLGEGTKLCLPSAQQMYDDPYKTEEMHTPGDLASMEILKWVFNKRK